jgi:hypothetical protein
MIVETNNLDLNEDDVLLLSKLEIYKNIVNKNIKNEEIVDYAIKLIEEDENLEFTTKNAKFFINKERPIFKLRFKNNISDKRNYLYEKIFTKVTDYINDKLLENEEIQKIKAEIESNKYGKLFFSLISSSIFSIMIDTKTNICFVELYQ